MSVPFNAAVTAYAAACYNTGLNLLLYHDGIIYTFNRASGYLIEKRNRSVMSVRDFLCDIQEVVLAVADGDPLLVTTMPRSIVMKTYAPLEDGFYVSGEYHCLRRDAPTIIFLPVAGPYDIRVFADARIGEIPILLTYILFHLGESHNGLSVSGEEGKYITRRTIGDNQVVEDIIVSITI